MPSGLSMCMYDAGAVTLLPICRLMENGSWHHNHVLLCVLGPKRPCPARKVLTNWLIKHRIFVSPAALQPEAMQNSTSSCH